MFVGQRLLGVCRDFCQIEDENSEDNGKGLYMDEKGDYVFYEPTFFVCSMFKVENGTTFINLPREFLKLNPPTTIYFCVDTKKNNLYLSFIEALPEVPCFPRMIQKAGKNNCQVRIPFPRELKGIFFPDRFQRLNLTEVEKDLFKCEFCWEKMQPVIYERKKPEIYDGD